MNTIPIRLQSLVLLALAILHASECYSQDQDTGVTPTNASFIGDALVNPEPKLLAGVVVDHPDLLYREGETMTVEFGAQVPAYLYLLYHQADGSCHLLYPNSARHSSLLPANTKIKIPTSGDSFRFVTRPPFGREILQVLASREQVPELDTIAASSPGVPVSSETLSDAAQRLKDSGTDWAESRTTIQTVPDSTSAAASTASAARYGLFIGVGDYAASHIETHEELRRSAEVLYSAMLEKGGLSSDTARLVADSDATKNAIKKHVTEWLPSVSRPGDTVFIYFSGHSAVLQDGGDPSEIDGADETLCPYDISSWDDSLTEEQNQAAYRKTNITDDELAYWLQALQGRQVVLVLDTCHAAGVVEGKGIVEALTNEAARLKDLSQLNTLVLASCGADEQALFEGMPNNTMWFTYYLAQSVQRGERITVQDAFRSAALGVQQSLRDANETRIQEPAMFDQIMLPILLVP